MFEGLDFSKYSPEGVNPELFKQAITAQVMAESGGNYDSAVSDIGNKKTNAGIVQWQAQLLRGLGKKLIDSFPDIAKTYPALANPDAFGDVWNQDMLDQWKELSKDTRVKKAQEEYAAEGMKRNVELARKMGVKNPITSLLAADILHQYVPKSGQAIIHNAVTKYGDPSYYDLIGEIQEFHGGKDPYPARRKQFDKYLVQFYNKYGHDPVYSRPLIPQKELAQVEEIPDEALHADVPTTNGIPTPKYEETDKDLLTELYNVVNTRRANTATDQIQQMQQSFVPEQASGFMQQKASPNPLITLILRLLLNAL